MKRNDEFILRKVAGNTIVVPVGAASVSFNGLLTLNETGAFLWDRLTRETSLDALAAALCENYDVEPGRAQKDTAAFLDRLRGIGALLD